MKIKKPLRFFSRGSSELKIQNPKSKIQNSPPDSVSQIQNPKSKIQNSPPDSVSQIQNPKSKIQNSLSSFTLVEMMVVIAIIAILATLLFPAVTGSRNRAKKRQAMVEVCNIVMAARKFSVENGRWPNQVSDSGDATYFTDNHIVINALTIPASNDRSRIYLQLQSGSVDANGNYVDPWGWPYIICLDESGDGSLSLRVVNASYTNCFTGDVITNYSLSETIASHAGVAAVSMGSGEIIASWSEMQ